MMISGFAEKDPCILSCMAQMNLIVTPAFEAALEKVMRQRGFGNKSEAVRTIIQEVAGAVETPEEIKRKRREAFEKLRGSWANMSTDLPRHPDGSVNWKAWKEEIHEGMP